MIVIQDKELAEGLIGHAAYLAKYRCVPRSTWVKVTGKVSVVGLGAEDQG